MNKIKKIYFLFFFILLFLPAKISYGFLTDGIVASVDNTPVTLNELYFLFNFDKINNLKYRKINKTIPKSKLKHILNIYINRLAILKWEEKTGGLSVSENKVNLLAASFRKKFKIIHKLKNFNSFLAKFGYNNKDFYLFCRNILIEKTFIKERLDLFLFTLENTLKISQSSKNKYAKELSIKLKDMLFNLKKHLKIEINDNFY